MSQYQYPDLGPLFAPRSIALVGASDREGSIGAHTLANLTEHSLYEGELFLINPGKEQIGQRKCYKSVADLPGPVDVAVIVIPAGGVVDVVEQAAALGTKFAVILSSGFGEVDEAGQLAEQALRDISARTGIRVYGPNCPGLCNITDRVGMTFSPAFRNDLRAGPIGLATQGGGLGRTLMQAMDRGLGFARWASCGNEADLQVADFIHHMAETDDVKVIITLIEGIKDGHRFIGALQHAADRGKPVVGLKVGKSEYGAKAAQSHTASMTGSAEVNSAVFRRYGLIEVDDMDELVDVAALLARKVPTGNEKVAVFATSGGAASLCADTVGIAGLTLATFAPETTAALQSVLPDYASIGNPVDTTSAPISNPGTFRAALLPVAEDPNVAIVLCPIAMDYGKSTERTAQSIIDVQNITSTPVCPIWMSDRTGVSYGMLNASGITPFRSLRNMGKAVRRWIDYGTWRSTADLSRRPLLADVPLLAPTAATTTLTEVEAKLRLANAGVPVARAKLAYSPQEAGEIAEAMDCALAMKVVSRYITHKSDVGGVLLGIQGQDAATDAYSRIETAVRAARPDVEIEGILLEPMARSGGVEMFVGISRDPVFGHMLTLGLGGVYVEIFADVARRMLPVSAEDVRGMIIELKSAPLLFGARGKASSDVAAFADLVASVSDFVTANAADLEEMDLNPVWIGPEGEGAIALDAVMVVRQ